jgi:hypothetical protein
MSDLYNALIVYKSKACFKTDKSFFFGIHKDYDTTDVCDLETADVDRFSIYYSTVYLIGLREVDLPKSLLAVIKAKLTPTGYIDEIPNQQKEQND